MCSNTPSKAPTNAFSQQAEEELLLCCIDSFKWSNSATKAMAHTALNILNLNQTEVGSTGYQSNTVCCNHKASSFTSKARKSESSSSYISRLIHLIVLDFPLLVICTFMFATLSARHLYTHYWTPIMNHLAWTPDKKISRRTYYRRECGPSDIVPTLPDDLILDPSTSPRDAAEKVMRYGGAIFPNILSAESMGPMRDFVLKQNRNLNDDIEIPLISQNQRWSFAIGGDMDPSVPPILHEIATNVFLQSSLDLLFGKDPAVVEFTAITSAYGAGSQNWHADSWFSSSYMHFARSFVPYYSLFIPLQDTTSKMGATSLCPGTHFCGKESNLGDLCEELGYQVSDTTDGTWKAGDGFLMHLNVYHRGPAHTDPTSPERVMLIMSIAPRPIGTGLETRQLGLGTSYSQRWDMWGLTMKDLVNIEAAMRWPEKILRTFGIYKNWRRSHDSNSVHWGWDYLTVACSRIVNNQMGFRYDDLKKYVKKMRKRGILSHAIFGYLPDLINDTGSDEAGERRYSEDFDETQTGWREYIAETLRRLTVTASLFFTLQLLFYVAAANLTRTKGFASRVLVTLIIAALLNGFFLHYVANSPWGRDARSVKSHSDPFSNPASIRASSVKNEHIKKPPTTLPQKSDVFLATRLDSHLFHAHNTIFEYQDGNQLWQSLIDDVSPFFNSADVELTSPMYSDIVANIVERIEKNGGRFLLQNNEGNWEILATYDAIKVTDINIQAQSDIVRKKMYQEIKHMISTCRHGRLRETIMSSSFCLFLLNDVQDALFPSNAYIRLRKEETLRRNKSCRLEGISSSPPRNISFRLERISSSPTVVKESSVYRGLGTTPHHSFTLGDVVEGSFPEGWFKGTIIDLDEDDTYIVRYDDGSTSEKQFKLRPFLPYEFGQIIEAFVDGVTRGRIQDITSDSRFTIVADDGTVLERIPLSLIYRIS